jgi:hypothetical protein
MYTVEGIYASDTNADVVENAADWRKAWEKATELRKKGLRVEIWHMEGLKVELPDADQLI